MAASADRLEARRLVEQHTETQRSQAPGSIDVRGLGERMGRRLSYAEDRALRDAHRLGVGAEAEEALVEGGGVEAVEKLIQGRRDARARGLAHRHGKTVGAEVARLLEMVGL